MAASRRGVIIYGNVGVAYCKNKKSNPLLFLHAVIAERTLVSTDGEQWLWAQRGQNKTSQSNERANFSKRLYSVMNIPEEYKTLPAVGSLFWTEENHCLECLTAFATPKISIFDPHFKQSILSSHNRKHKTPNISLQHLVTAAKKTQMSAGNSSACWSAVSGLSVTNTHNSSTSDV